MRLLARFAAAIALVVAGLVSVTRLDAQQSGPRDQLVVYVYDAGDGAPLVQATVTFVLEGKPQRRYTDEEGRFFVTVPLNGHVEFEARRIGYTPTTVAATFPVPRNRVEINLERASARLATVEVNAGPVFAGIVASSTSQLPITGASVSITGGSGRMQADSMGRFALPTDGRQEITLSVTAKGFAPRVVVDRLSPGESREMLVLLDPMSEVGNRLFQNMDDRDQRIRWRGTMAGAVGGRELRGSARALGDALRVSPSATSKGLIFDEAACLFVDGDPRPGQTVASFSTDDVDFVEFYAEKGDYFGVLEKRWPANQPCGSGSSVANRSDRVKYIVIWTR